MEWQGLVDTDMYELRDHLLVKLAHGSYINEST